MFSRRTLLLLLVVFFGRLAPLHAQGSDIIRGQVLGSDKKPMENVNVQATSLTDQTSRTAKTNKDGRFTIVFAGGGGDYLMTFQSIGTQPVRFEVRREVDEDVLIANATLSKAPVTLQTVTVNGNRDRPDRNGNQQDVGGHEQSLNTSNIPLDALGDLSAMAATLPGITLIPGADGGASGFSVLGLGADQNNITLNGLDFGSTDLPRDATTQTRVTTSSYDVSRGGFSGGQISLRTASGSNYKQWSIHQTVDAPSLQYTDAVGRALGQQFTNLVLSGRASGPITFDKAFYSFSWQVGRRSNNLQDLLNTNALALERSGVSDAAVQDFLNELSSENIPTTSSAIPDQRIGTRGSFLSSFDFSPSGTHNFNVTLNGSVNDQDATNLATTAVPLHGGNSRSYNGGLQARHSSYFWDTFLDETSGGIQGSTSAGNPYIDLPSATVRVNSTFADGTTNLSNLQFGGSPQLPTNSHTLTGEVQNQLSWFSLDNKHRFKFGQDIRYNRYSQDNTTNRYGTFLYNSLEDFQNGAPASFTRRLQVNRRIGDDLGGSAWLGDSYRRTQRLQLTYGVRVDASHFQGNPTYNPAIDSIYHQRNDKVPRGVYLSPRLGFSWTYGTSPQIGGFEGAQRGSRGQISGGFGQFQNLPSSQLIAAAADQTGLPNAAQQLLCTGDAVPNADWAQYILSTNNIPNTCVGSVSTYSSTVPNVTLFAPDYTPTRSWRGNLNWAAPILNNRFRLSSGVTYSVNLNQQSVVDLNFNENNPIFTLPNENRPVYVNPSSIYPSTGAVISRDARVSQSYANVYDYLSDLTSHTTQVSVGISPVRFNSSLAWSATYIWQKVVDQSRGFQGGNTAGDPYLVQWARGARDARHQITYNVSYNIKQAVNVSLYGRFQSGNPFTPTVSGDINGDGSTGNDRAFVYDPDHMAWATTANDTALATKMQSLLTTAPKSVRDCLTKQINTIAGRNSCESPWSASLSMRMQIVNPRALKLPDRVQIGLGIANPLTGLDELVHGSDHMHGWGSSNSADQTLLYVRGFDPSTNKYIYDVNPRFGVSSQSRILQRSPMQLTLDVQVDVGPTRERQDLFLQMRAGRGGRGNKLGEQQIKVLYMRTYAGPFEQILRQQDSLGLSNDVADSIAILNKTYGKVLDSIWTPIAKYLAGLPDKYDFDEAYDRVATAENASVDKLSYYGPLARGLLTDEQIRKLPTAISVQMDKDAIRLIRPGRRGGGRGGLFGG